MTSIRPPASPTRRSSSLAGARSILIKAFGVAALATIAVLTIAAPAFAADPSPATEAAGPQSGTWATSSSPILLTGDVFVPAGATLTIEAGVRVAAGPYSITVESGATLRGAGESGRPIFLSAADPDLGWRGIHLRPGSSADLVDCIVERVTSGPSPSGAAIRAESAHATLTRCAIRFNSNLRPRQRGNGGGVSCSKGELKLVDCYFRGNRADSGGAVHLTGTRAAITRTKFELNFSSLSGGALYAGPDSEVEIHASTFMGNQAERPGGAIAGWNRAVVTVDNSILTGNRSTAGGAVYSRYADVSISNCTLTLNRALSGSALAVERGRGIGISIDHSIVWDPLGSAPIAEQAERKLRMRYSCIAGGWSGVGNHQRHPRFRNASRGDFSLQDDSPCRDAGEPNATVGRSDLRGNPRVDDKRDLGALEWSPAQPSRPDLDRDGTFDAGDLEAWLVRYQSPDSSRSPVPDLDDDSVLNLADLMLAITALFESSRTATEPE